MAVFMVSYDLNKPGKDYSSLYEELKKKGAWWHYLDSTWLIDTAESSKQLATRLLKKMDDSDWLLVMEVRRPAHGWLSQDAWDWINEHV